MTLWITGCSSGLGKALTEYFLAQGHTIAACARRRDRIEAMSKSSDPSNWFSVCDVASDKDVATFCRKAFDHTGAPDLLINNASIINQPARLWEVPAEDFDQLIAVNLSGTANMIRHAVPLMIDAGSGIIVNLSSGWGRSTSPEVAPYCASKWGVEGMTQALSQELPAGLAAVALNPGVIDTDMLRCAFGDDASAYPNAEDWARTAAPFILGLSSSDNGKALTAP
ncbi:SDR family oxidoreductase [Haloferula sp.]|uniref:SDR family oxidoreductase n=1 Tax=Haloferula sp. TaxID=2497595 RepID=UPI00329B2907